MHDYPRTQDVECCHGITWIKLVELEPKLGAFLWEARREGATCRDWSDVPQVFASLRNSLSDLVGFVSSHRGHPILGWLGAYEVAYWKLYDAVVELLPRPRRSSRKETASLFRLINRSETVFSEVCQCRNGCGQQVRK